MRLLLVLLHIFLVGTQIWASAHYREELEDNEFAEFENFEDDDEDMIPGDADTASQRPAPKRDINDEDEIDMGEEEDEEAIVEVA
jgi:hypothetical protein